MKNKNRFGLVFLQNYKSNSEPFPLGAERLALEEAISKTNKLKMEKSSLAFLSTIMQTENINWQENWKHQSEPFIEKEEAGTLITNQQGLAQKSGIKKDPLQAYFHSKLKKAEKDQKSITKLLGRIGKERSTKKQISYLAESLNRNRTYTVMPVTNKEGLSHRKKVENRKQMKVAFRDFIAKRSVAENEKSGSIGDEKEIFFNIDPKQLQAKANNTANLYSIAKDGRTRSRIYQNRQNSTSTHGNPRAVTEWMDLKQARRSRRDQREFKWTLLGDRRIFKLKTTCE